MFNEILSQSIQLPFSHEPFNDQIGDVNKVTNYQNSKNNHEDVAKVERHLLV